ncbi:helix-turn-helix domain-containing protein [Ferrimonas lipolytica]|uniref:Transcriptional regulator n=1 Tax=Ferrimonas lipolytica TaxID=2724191 RepID=A0A6H1UCL8_9GAMM|nr:transcriptional regulator [Ferrimonas lipolytica]QIZ76825.1 transcriptional regulator [Ferrimonas lipolytica]
MLDIAVLDKAAAQLHQVMPWVSGISSPEQYQELIATMGVLIEDYDAHQPLIDLMFPVIERYEEAEQFSEFNQAIDKLDSGIAMLRFIIDQHKLTLSDFKNEIGAKSTVSMILSVKRALTINHIKALSARFGVPASLFIG